MSEQQPPAIRITLSAGDPTDEELAAATVALLGLAGGAPAPTPAAPPAWGRAARFEATGQAPFRTSNDARLQHRPTGALPPGAV